MLKLNKIISYPLSVIHYICFAICLLVFHPIQWFLFNVFGYKAHKKSVDVLNWFLIRCLNILGSNFSAEMNSNLPAGVPVVIVSNHQSMWDIPPVVWYFRKYHPKFISKKSLGKGVPSVSYNLRHGGSILIDRKNKEESIEKIEKFAQYLVDNNRAGVIFAEGTRSRSNEIKDFKRGGLETLFANMRTGYVIPVSIKDSWKLQRWGMFPIQFGVNAKIIAHPAIKIESLGTAELIDKVEETIRKGMNS